mmetsp:Transcript_23322/g.46516  ORF Transcript_23322/g.46516 Transcript_23322/m.46516 type:complete len:128 (+) Transcript_23322:147-530(+)
MDSFIVLRYQKYQINKHSSVRFKSIVAREINIYIYTTWTPNGLYLSYCRGKRQQALFVNSTLRTKIGNSIIVTCKLKEKRKANLPEIEKKSDMQVANSLACPCSLTESSFLQVLVPPPLLSSNSMEK